MVEHVTHRCCQGLVGRAEFAEARGLLHFNFAVLLTSTLSVTLFAFQLSLHFEPQERLGKVKKNIKLAYTRSFHCARDPFDSDTRVISFFSLSGPRDIF